MKKAKIKTMFIIGALMIVMASFALAYITVTPTFPVTEWSTSISTDFNFTVETNVTNLPWCGLYVNDTLKANYTDVINNTPHISGVAVPESDGQTYSWNLTCFSGAEIGNIFSAANFGVDYTSPAITLDNPDNNAYLANMDLESSFLQYTPTEASNPDTCLLYTNASGSWGINETEAGYTSGTQVDFNLSEGVADGSYDWNVLCNDSAENTAWAEDANRTFTFDGTPPSAISFASPANNVYSSDTTPEIIWTETTEANFEKYNLLVSTSVDMSSPTQSIDITSRTANSTTVSNLATDDVYYFRVDVSDLAGNEINSSVLIYNLDTNVPTVTLITPLDGTYSNDNTQDFNVTVVDDNPDSCILYLSNSSAAEVEVNTTTAGVVSGAVTTMTTLAMADGTYKFNVECNDSFGNKVNTSDSLLDLTMDTTAPTAVDIVSTWHNQNNTDKTPQLYWSTTTETNFEKYVATAYTLAGVLEDTVEVTTRTTNYADMTLTEGFSYSFNVTAYDLAGNVVRSTNDTVSTSYYVDPVCGTLNEGWNMCGATWTTARNLSRIGAESGANFVTVWNLSNEWQTCNYAVSPSGENCDIDVGIQDSMITTVWVYVNSSKEWRNRTWVADESSAGIKLYNITNGWNNVAGVFRNGRTLGHMGEQFNSSSVSMLSLPYNNGTSVPLVNKAPYSGMSVNSTIFNYGRGLWVFYNGSTSTTNFSSEGW